MAQHFLLSKQFRDLSLIELMGLSEVDALMFLAEIRWGSKHKQTCPDCGTWDAHYFRRTRRQWQCKHCFHTFSLKSGTLLSDLKLTYLQLVVAVFVFISAANGISAIEITKYINVTHSSALLFLHKIKEAIVRHRDLSPMEGHVQIDGTYLGGKPRKSRVRNQKNKQSIKEKIESKGKVKRKLSANDRRNWRRRVENRRLLIVIRQVTDVPKQGSNRTIVVLAKGESEEYVKPLVEKYVKPGSTISTDENGAYNFLSAEYHHQTVEHSKEYATIDGINNNQAESYNSRIKRFVYGVSHRAMPQYIFDYACEMAWREDMRRSTLKEIYYDLWSKIFNSGMSEWWRGYYQGHRRNDEMLMF